jgi:hypothetical protein
MIDKTDAAVPDLVRRAAHVAFEVTDLSSELAGREILIPPNSPSDGVRIAEKRYSALHFRGPGTDLRVGLADDHLWLGGGMTAVRVPNIRVSRRVDYRVGVSGWVPG